MQKNDPYAAFKFPEFNIFIVMRFAVVFAWSMQFVVVEWLVYSITKDPLSLGIIGLMEVIPAVSMALFAGHIVDQKEKRNLLIKCIIGFTIINLGFFLVTSPQLVNNWNSKTILYCIYGLSFFGGLLRAFIGPTIFTLMALLVPKSIYPNATTWNSSTRQMATVLGPAMAGFTITWIGEHWSMCIVFSLSMVALIATFLIKKKPILNPKIGENIFKSLREGLLFVYNTKAVLAALTLDMFAVLFGGAIALLPIFAQDILKVGSEGFGVLRAAPAVGSFLVMLFSAYVPLTKRSGMKLLIAIFGFGISIIVFGLSELFWLSVIALFFTGVTDGVSMIIRQTILQLKTPDNMRGRVSAVNSMFVGSSNELGAFESGVTAKLMGTVTAVVFGGTMTLITVVGTALKFPTFRELDLRKDVEEIQE